MGACRFSILPATDQLAHQWWRLSNNEPKIVVNSTCALEHKCGKQQCADLSLGLLTACSLAIRQRNKEWSSFWLSLYWTSVFFLFREDGSPGNPNFSLHLFFFFLSLLRIEWTTVCWDLQSVFMILCTGETTETTFKQHMLERQILVAGKCGNRQRLWRMVCWPRNQ
jgi:hypothetical protein